jgi:hypothetical protein
VIYLVTSNELKDPNSINGKQNFVEDSMFEEAEKSFEKRSGYILQIS